MKKILLSLAILTSSLLAGGEMTVYKSKYCGCCGKWIEHMEKSGYKIKTVLKEDMNSVKRELGIPLKLESCHTGVIDGYLVEGHVPADVVDEMLEKKPNIKGIASPGMPIGSPGMEQGDLKDPNPIVAFDKNSNFFIFANR